MAPLLAVSHISRRFGGLQALSDVSFCVENNAVHGLIGPNGAGKSTLINVIGDEDKGATGSILLDGREVIHLKPRSLARAGVGRVFQAPRLFPGLTVLETVMVGCHAWTRGGFLGAITGSSRAEEKAIASLSEEILDRLSLARYAREYPHNLPYGHQRTLDIARALAGKPRLLLLDEPAAGLNPEEMWTLADLLKRLKSEGLTLLLVEHNMDLVMTLCEAITVLSFGKLIAEGSPEQIRADPEVIRVYLGSAPIAAA